jgi:lipopolysaccharide transport system permease protein
MNLAAIPSTRESQPAGEGRSAPVLAPMVRIRPPRAWEALDISAIWRFRDLLFALAERDIKLRYRQTLLGVLWVVFQPLLGAGIFAFIFGRVARLDSGGVPYLLFAYTGLLAWNLFSGIVLKSAGSLVANAPLVAKIFFPRVLLPVSSVLSTLLDFVVASAVGVLLFVAYGQSPGWALLTIPLWLAALVLIATGVGLICAALAVAYRDVLHILPVVLQFLLYGSPVGYTIAVIPPGWPRTLFKLNPLAPLIEGFRTALLGRGFIHWPSSIYAGGAAVAIFVVGLIIFRRLERQFADVI